MVLITAAAGGMEVDIKFSTSVLLVRDISISRKFYEQLLGQQVELDHGECVVYSGGFSIWEREYAEKLIFGNPLTRLQGSKHDLELYFETQDLDEVCNQIQAAGVKMAHGIQEQPWGQRGLRFFDPDQYVIEVAEPMRVVIKRYLQQGMTAEQAALRTSMPLEVVKSIQ